MGESPARHFMPKFVASSSSLAMSSRAGFFMNAVYAAKAVFLHMCRHAFVRQQHKLLYQAFCLALHALDYFNRHTVVIQSEFDFAGFKVDSASRMSRVCQFVGKRAHIVQHTVKF